MMSLFSEAADLWLSRLDLTVKEGRRSPGPVETYRRQLKNHILPALGELRLVASSSSSEPDLVRPLEVEHLTCLIRCGHFKVQRLQDGSYPGDLVGVTFGQVAWADPQ